MTHSEAATIIGVSTKTVQRRLNLGLLSLTEALGDLKPTTLSVDD
jgi:DNA-directed RNA polymerase specialized sigma24 family protein